MSVPLSIAEAQERIREFVRERDWEQYHDPKNLVMLLASEVGELVAEFRWLTPEQSRSVSGLRASNDRIRAEVGDVGIALLSLCDKLGIDLLDAVSQKIATNETRYPAEASRGRPDRPTDS